MVLQKQINRVSMGGKLTDSCKQHEQLTTNLYKVNGVIRTINQLLQKAEQEFR